MSIMRRLPAGTAALLLLAIAPLAACGSDAKDAAATSSAGGKDGGTEGAEESGTPQTVDCPGKATAVDLPAGFPAPLPNGAVVVAVQQRDGGRTVVTAV